jgi:hypothetical protein
MVFAIAHLMKLCIDSTGQGLTNKAVGRRLARTRSSDLKYRMKMKNAVRGECLQNLSNGDFVRSEHDAHKLCIKRSGRQTMSTEERAGYLY